jgi:glucose uptake protein GlcU
MKKLEEPVERTVALIIIGTIVFIAGCIWSVGMILQYRELLEDVGSSVVYKLLDSRITSIGFVVAVVGVGVLFFRQGHK